MELDTIKLLDIKIGSPIEPGNPSSPIPIYHDRHIVKQINPPEKCPYREGNTNQREGIFAMMGNRREQQLHVLLNKCGSRAACQNCAIWQSNVNEGSKFIAACVPTLEIAKIQIENDKINATAEIAALKEELKGHVKGLRIVHAVKTLFEISFTRSEAKLIANEKKAQLNDFKRKQRILGREITPIWEWS